MTKPEQLFDQQKYKGSLKTSSGKYIGQVLWLAKVQLSGKTSGKNIALVKVLRAGKGWDI